MSIGVDAPRVESAAEAELLLLHHLRLAAMYFEATDNNLAERLPGEDFSSPAMLAWAASMEALYPED